MPSANFSVRGVHLEQPNVASCPSSRPDRAPFRASSSRSRCRSRSSRADRGSALMPVPTPTSSTRSPGRMPIRWIACTRPGCRRRPEGEVVDRRELLVDARRRSRSRPRRHRQRARRRVGPENLFINRPTAVDVQNQMHIAERLYIRQLQRSPSMTAKRGIDVARSASKPGYPAPASLNAAAISRAIATPSAWQPPPDRPPCRMRSSSASGTRMPGTSFAMNSAFRSASNGKTPAMIGSRRRLDPLQERARTPATSKTGRVNTNSAPASTLYSNRRSSSSRFDAAGFTDTPMWNAVGAPIDWPPISQP